MIENILKFLGLITFTYKDYSKMSSYLTNRIQQEWDDKKVMQELSNKYRKIALNIASKYKDENILKELTK